MLNQTTAIARDLTQAIYAQRAYRGGLNIKELRENVRRNIITASTEGDMTDELAFLDGRSSEENTPEIREWIELLVEQELL